MIGALGPCPVIQITRRAPHLCTERTICSSKLEIGGRFDRHGTGEIHGGFAVAKGQSGQRDSRCIWPRRVWRLLRLQNDQCRSDSVRPVRFDRAGGDEYQVGFRKSRFGFEDTSYRTKKWFA